MCILKKTLPYTTKNRNRLSKYPTIYVICHFARVGCLSFPFTRKYDRQGRPLVYQFDDHNGLYPEYCLRNVNEVTTGCVHEWTTNADDVQQLINKWQTKHDEHQQALVTEYQNRIKECGGEENYLMTIFGQKGEQTDEQK